MWTRRSVLASALPTALWPAVNSELMEPDQLRTFTSRREAMLLYFANKRIKDIEQKTGVSLYKLARMAQRCLEVAPDGRIFGFRALIPHIRTGRYQRHAELKEKRQHQQGGQAGALGAMLARFPDIEDDLVKCIKQDCKHKQIPENKLRAKDLHRLFIQCVKGKGVSESEWPFTTQYLGVRTIQRYMNQVLNDNFSRSVFSREGSAAKAHMNVGTGHASFLRFEEPYDAVEIDAYKVDAHLTVAFETPEGTETEVLLERLWLVAAVERASTAMLAYDMVYRSEVTADNILKVIRDALTKKWQPKDLTLPLNYPPGGGLPSGIIPEAYGAVWNVLLFDGALACRASTILAGARQLSWPVDAGQFTELMPSFSGMLFGGSFLLRSS